MNSNLVSIITPLYNAEKFITETFASVVNQTYNNWEWVIIDDRSTDNSLSVLKELAKNEPRVKISQNEENSGSGKTRNRAINQAAGSIIAFLDSDDTWHPQKLERHVKFMLDNNAAFSHTSYGYLDEDGNKIRISICPPFTRPFLVQDNNFTIAFLAV